LKSVSSLLFLSALSFVSCASAGTIFTSSFGGPSDIFADTNPVGGFTVTNGNVDLLTTGGGMYGVIEPGLCPGVSACVDLDGNSTTAGGGLQGTLSTASLTLAPGQYTLSFDLFKASGTTGSTIVTLGSWTETITDGTASANADGEYSFTITLASGESVPLTFASNNPGYDGNFLADVNLATLSPAPEPSTMLLMSLPLLAFGSQMFRRSRG